MTTDLVGRTLADRFDVLALIGEGGMGAVYRARDRELDDDVALKVIRDELAGDPAMVERFRSEVKLARRVTHTNVARTFELGRAGGVLFCTMELIDGESLTARMRRGRLAPSEAVAIACALCDGLAAAHAAGIIHRDLKPDNVLLARDGRVVLADFGVAALRAAAGEMSGTPAYMAPEQARGEPPTPAVDVYAVGVVLAEMLTGRRDRTVDGELADVIARATAQDPAHRLGTADLLRRALAPHKRADLPVTPAQVIARGLDVHGVVVLAPTRAADATAPLYLGQAVHAELLARLARKPRLRVLPRAQSGAALEVVLEVGSALDVRVGAARLSLPLAIDRIDQTAEAIAATIASELAAPVGGAASDLLLQARYVHVQQGNAGIARANELLRRAHELAPDDARIAANLANLRIRSAFLVTDGAHEAMAEARALAHDAIMARPDLVDAQLAAGHVALHSGEPVAAAAHYRTAITCAPLDAEAHEKLGLMLLEAGYIDEALARLDEAIAIEPHRFSARWELARAWALEQRWPEHDALVEELARTQQERGMTRLRFAAWRGDAKTAKSAPVLLGAFDADMATAYKLAIIDRNWVDSRGVLMARAYEPSASTRRRTFIAQIVAEVAARCGDVDACNELIAHAAGNGLFDLHWLDRCPMLDTARPTAAFAALRARIKERADAILDALYGDHVVAVTDTTIASRVPG